MASPARELSRAKPGAGAFHRLYSLTAVVVLVWIELKYFVVPGPALWEPPTAVHNLPLSILLLLLIAATAAFAPCSPTSIFASASSLKDSSHDLFRLSRHPIMWATGLWAMMHVAALDSVRGDFIFGKLAGHAFSYPHLIEVRKARGLGTFWEEYKAARSYTRLPTAPSERGPVHWREIEWPPVLAGMVPYGILLVFHECITRAAPTSFVLEIIG